METETTLPHSQPEKNLSSNPYIKANELFFGKNKKQNINTTV